VGGGGDWIGLANFRYLAGSPVFASAIRNTIVLVVVSDAFKLAIGLGLALLVNERIPIRGLFRSFLMLPWAMPAFVAFLTWRVLYQPIGGGINLVLTNTGIYPEIIDWLGQRSTAMPAVIAASVWRGFPFWFISILAALQNIPAELYEAARVDGANAWQRFRAVTWPGIRRVVIITTLLSSIWTANSFESVWLLTQGGPSDATMVFPVLAYFGMQTQRIGEAAAVSVAMLPALLILVFVTTSLMQGDESERD
jgi:multiple sugar transport system permease protein